MKTPHTALRIPPELKEEAKEDAKIEGLNLSQWIFWAMRGQIKRNQIIRHQLKNRI